MAPGKESEPVDWSLAADTGDRADTIAGGPAGRRWASVAALLVGVLLGAAGMRYLDAGPAAPVAAAVVDVRVSLGAQAGDMSMASSDPVVSIPLVISNAAARPVTLTAIRVSGAGASLTSDPGGRPAQTLPTTLVPGRPVDTRIAIRSSCALTVRPPPQVTLVVSDPGGQVHDVAAMIPDLDSIWGQTLVAPACGLR